MHYIEYDGCRYYDLRPRREHGMSLTDLAISIVLLTIIAGLMYVGLNINF